MSALVASLQSGSQFGKYCFSSDSKFLFCCCGHIIKVFNTSTGESLHDLKGHLKTVTGVAVNPSNVLQVLSCGQDGRLIYWDYQDGVQLKLYNLHMSLNGIVSVSGENRSIIMLAQTMSQKSTYSVMLWKKRKSGTQEFSKPKMLIEQCDSDQGLVSFGCNKEYLASGLKHKLSIYSMKKGSLKVVRDQEKFNRNKALTCVACHPTEYCIATGIETGKITLWRSFFGDGKPVTSTFHWHALSVLCVDFTPHGSVLLSGGHECVLVRWQMENSNMRDYRPRLGAPITSVVSSPDGTLYATKHMDNVIQLMDINLKVLQVFRGLTQTMIGQSNKKNPIPIGLNFDPRSGTLVTNGLPGHLQFYSLSLGRQIFNLDIVGQNYISPENMDKPKVTTEVLSTAISGDGAWLATFEMWQDGYFSPEMRLKFWRYSTEAQTYSLNTTVECPHDEKITSMLFKPNVSADKGNNNNPVSLVTVGADLCFKLWTMVDDTNIYRVNTRWDCASVGFYRRMNVGCADFSQDSSTLAVGFEHLLTLWDCDSDSLTIRVTLSNCLPGKEAVSHIKFGSHDCSRHLVVATTQTLLVWDLSSLTVQWKMNVEVTVLIRDPASELMAFVTPARQVSIFRPSSSEMVYENDAISSSDVVGIVFVPDGRHGQIVDLGWPGKSQIYVYNVDQQLLTLDIPSESVDDSSSKVHVAQDLPLGALSQFMAEKVNREEDDIGTKSTIGKTKIADDTLISVLLHSNEPVSLIGEKFLSTLLVKKQHSPSSGSHQTTGEMASSDGEGASSSEEEEDDMETDQVKLVKPSYQIDTTQKPASVQEQVSAQEQVSVTEDLDRLLSRPLDWLQWCSKLHLK